MGIEKLTGIQKKALEEIRKFLTNSGTPDYNKFTDLIGRAGYKIKINGGGHNEIYFNSERVRSENGLPVIFSMEKSKITQGSCRKILRILLYDLELRYEI